MILPYHVLDQDNICCAIDGADACLSRHRALELAANSNTGEPSVHGRWQAMMQAVQVRDNGSTCVSCREWPAVSAKHPSEAFAVVCALQAVVLDPANTVLRNDDPDGASMTWVPLAHDIAESSDVPQPLLNVGVLRNALSQRDAAQARGRPFL